MDDNRIKVYLTKISNGVETVVVEPTTIYNLNKYVLIDDSVDTGRLSDNSYGYRFRVNINNEAHLKENYAFHLYNDDSIGSSNVGSSKYNIHPVLTLHLI